MCTQKAPHDYAKELYEEYKKFCDSYLVEKVIFPKCRPLSRLALVKQSRRRRCCNVFAATVSSGRSTA